MDRNRWLWLIVGAVALVLVVGSAFYLHQPKEAPQPAAAPPQAAAAAQPDAPLPPAAKTDADARKDLARLSSRPEWAQWLAASDLLDRWVVIVDNVSEDVSPRRQVDFIKVAPQTTPRLDYARYDFFADVVASVDAKGFAQLLRDVRPLLETAYHKLGYPDRKFDDVLAKALQRIIDAPVVNQTPALAPKGANFRFADDKLESLGPVEKHLLRMGPRNTTLIKAKARELAAALDFRIAAH